HPTSGASAETMAEYLLKLVNDHAQNSHMLRFALTTFEIVLDAGGKLDFTSERDVERSIAELKKLVG
ncbi:hypothetical protein, partial [Klebsiella pneumoniae]|uniref:hypothetical protein n=1 Tax=Klebsiella pneumoniae TaxID=573 RepID=UPI003EE35668